MSTHPDEQPLAASSVPADQQDDTAPAIDLPADTPQVFTVEDVLNLARLPERTANVCLRADLQADYDAALAELAQLITPTGELIADPEAALDENTARTRAQELVAQLKVIRQEMTAHMWHVRFRGLDSEALTVFNKRYKPKNDTEDRTDYNLRLVAETAIDPHVSFEQARQLAVRLGTKAMLELINTAIDVCYAGGVSVPKSPSSLLHLAQQ